MGTDLGAYEYVNREAREAQERHEPGNLRESRAMNPQHMEKQACYSSSQTWATEFGGCRKTQLTGTRAGCNSAAAHTGAVPINPPSGSVLLLVTCARRFEVLPPNVSAHELCVGPASAIVRMFSAFPPPRLFRRRLGCFLSKPIEAVVHEIMKPVGFLRNMQLDHLVPVLVPKRGVFSPALYT